MAAAGLGATGGAAAYQRSRAPAEPVAEKQVEARVTMKAPAAEPARPEPQMVAAPSLPSLAPEDDPEPKTLDDQLERLFGKLRAELWLSDAQMARVESIFAASPVLSQGNPVISRHPMSRAECQKIRAEAGLPRSYQDARCGAPNMVPIYDPGAGETAASAKACIDQFEFPDIPCEYPVVHVRANEAAEICAAVGKRLCDAHEWEGACAGAVHDPETEYEWPRPRMEAEFWHNKHREEVWSYGPKKNHAVCGTNSDRTPDCPGGGWNKCGSNTYPAGAFLECKSSFGAYDFHGNAAEHMNLPLRPEELRMQNGGGVTEMKGSWFVFSKIQAHVDDCRWRAPQWHESKVMNDNSHRNYHLGFRCCKDVE
ncbi:MAG: SUMF1/EgtB/PvdO family nonheme iron enzyme [Minicystis sp.]